MQTKATEAANMFVDSLPNGIRVPIPDDLYGFFINKHKAPQLADEILSFIAYTVASIIDAGSERDAVMENEALFDAILSELQGWTN